jgi:nucleosome binding factor SPN SPT16 subunit
MKTITDDPVGFIDNGGWTFLDPESDGEEAHNDDSDDEEDDAYEPTDAETEGNNAGTSRVSLNFHSFPPQQRMKTAK